MSQSNYLLSIYFTIFVGSSVYIYTQKQIKVLYTKDDDTHGYNPTASLLSWHTAMLGNLELPQLYYFVIFFVVDYF